MIELPFDGSWLYILIMYAEYKPICNHKLPNRVRNDHIFFSPPFRYFHQPPHLKKFDLSRSFQTLNMSEHLCSLPQNITEEGGRIGNSSRSLYPFVGKKNLARPMAWVSSLLMYTMWCINKYFSWNDIQISANIRALMFFFQFCLHNQFPNHCFYSSHTLTDHILLHQLPARMIPTQVIFAYH